MIRFAIITSVVMSAFFASAAWAAGAADDVARQHYEEGLKYYNLGEFPQAAVEYRAAYHAKPDPVILYNIAQAYRLGNDAQQALFFYRSYLRNLPAAANRGDVAEKIKRLERQLAEQKELATQPPSNALPLGSAAAPPAPVAPPPAVTSPPQLSAPQPDPLAVASSPSPPLTDRQPTPVYKKWWLWTTVGVVVVGVSLGVGLGLGISPTSPKTHFGGQTLTF